MKNADWDIEGDLSLLEIEEDEAVSAPSHFRRLLTAVTALWAACSFLMVPVSVAVTAILSMPTNNAIDMYQINQEPDSMNALNEMHHESISSADFTGTSMSFEVHLQGAMNMLDPDTEKATMNTIAVKPSETENLETESSDEEAEDIQTSLFDVGSPSTSVIIAGSPYEENQVVFSTAYLVTESVMQPQISTSTVEHVSNVYAAPSAERSTLDTYAAAEYVNSMLLLREDEDASEAEDEIA